MSQRQIFHREKRERRILLPSEPERIGAGGRSYFKGPLGLWPWPLFNVLLAMVETIRGRTYRGAFPKVATRRTEYIRNAEGRIIERYEEMEIT